MPSWSKESVGDFGRGVVIYRHRPVRANSVDDDRVVMKIVRQEHTALVVPRFRTPSGVVELGLWTMWAPMEHEPRERSMTAPSIYPCGMQRMSFNRINVCDRDTMQTFDTCALLSLQTLVDMQTANMDVAIDGDEALVIDVAYVIAFEVAIDYFAKEETHANRVQKNSAPPQMQQLGPAIDEHRSLLKASNVDVEGVIAFRKETQQLAQTLCTTALRLSGIDPVERSVRVMAMAGMACLACVYCAQSSFYSGAMLCDQKEQQMRVLAAYASVAQALHGERTRDVLTKSLLTILLHDRFGMSKVLGLHAVVLKPGMKCVRCGNKVTHGDISTGQCYICPISSTILCTSCTEDVPCEVCVKAAQTVDFERVAIENVVRLVVVARRASKVEAMLHEQVRRNVAQSRATRASDEATQRQLDEKGREAASASDTLAQARAEAKKAEKRAKKSDACARELRGELRATRAELEGVRAEHNAELKRLRLERSRTEAEATADGWSWKRSLEEAEAALDERAKAATALATELSHERSKSCVKDRMVDDLTRRLAESQPFTDAD